MRFAVGLIVFAIAMAALLPSHQHKPFELMVEPSGWSRYAASDVEADMIDSWACARVFIPYRVTTEKRRGVTQT